MVCIHFQKLECRLYHFGQLLFETGKVHNCESELLVSHIEVVQEHEFVVVEDEVDYGLPYVLHYYRENDFCLCDTLEAIHSLLRDFEELSQHQRLILLKELRTVVHIQNVAHDFLYVLVDYLHLEEVD